MAVVLILTHGVAVAAIWVSALPIHYHVALKLMVLISLWFSLRQAGWLNSPVYAKTLRVHPAGELDSGDRVEIRLRDGATRKGEIVEGSVALPWLVTMAVRLEGRARWRSRATLVLLADSADAESLRRLRVRLRWGKPAPV
jgi:toxin CptA